MNYKLNQFVHLISIQQRPTRSRPYFTFPQVVFKEKLSPQWFWIDVPDLDLLALNTDI